MRAAYSELSSAATFVGRRDLLVGDEVAAMSLCQAILDREARFGVQMDDIRRFARSRKKRAGKRVLILRWKFPNARNRLFQKLCHSDLYTKASRIWPAREHSPRVPHDALADIARRDPGELAVEGRSRRPALPAATGARVARPVSSQARTQCHRAFKISSFWLFRRSRRARCDGA
jgi:hypothetical protein